MDIARLKQLRPYYANLDDDQIVDLVQKHDYPDRSRNDIAKALGVKLPAPAQPALPERSLFGAINDSVINAANSAAGVVKSGVDLFAPDSLLSQGIADFITMGQEKQSDKQKALNRQLSTNLQNAEGPLDKAGAYVKHALTVDPLKTASDAAGNVLPFMGAGRLLAATRAPGAVATAANMGLAGIVGAGEVRGNIWDKISRTPDADLLEQSPEYAELRIQRGMTEAQAKQELGANLSRNLPEVGAVGALGALSGKFGLEGMAAGVAPKIGRVGSAAVGLADEALQGGAEQVATNKGVQRALPEQSLLDDVPLNMAMEGLGGMLGGAALGGRERVPDAGPLSRAANTALDQREKEQAAQSPLLALPAPTIRVTEEGQAITTDPRLGGILDVTPVASAREAEDAAILAAARAAQQSPEQAMAQSQANIAMMAGRQQPTSLEMAQARVAGLAEQAGIEASVIPHPGGRGFMVIPSAWVAEPMRQQVPQGQQAGMLPSPDMAAPDGPFVADPQGLRPQTYAEQQAARQAVRDVMDERDRMAQMGLTPDVERAQRTRALAQIQPGDITTPKGGAFKAEGAAKLAARKKGVTGEVVQVRGGWVFRPAAETVEDTTNGATGNAAAVAERPGSDAGPAIGAGVADVGPDADAAVRRVDTAADRLVADSAGDLSGRNAVGRDEGGVIEQDAPQAAAGDTAAQAEPQGADARGPGQDAAGAPAAGVSGAGRAADVQAAGLKPGNAFDALRDMEEDAGEGFKKNDRGLKAVRAAMKQLAPDAQAKVARAISQFTKKEKDGTTLVDPRLYDVVEDQFAWTPSMLSDAIQAAAPQVGAKPKAMPAFIKTKTVPQMTADELREAQAYYGPNHKRAKAIEKALAKIGPQQAESGEGEKLPPTDIRDGDKVLVDGEVYTVTGSLKEGRKNVGVVADRDSDTDPLNGVKRVMLRGDDAIRAKIAADNLPAVKPSLSVEFGGKTYPVDSVEDAQQKWVKFQETAGAGVSQVGNGVDVKDQTGKVVGRISYNGRAWDADGNLMAEAPAQEAQKKDDAPRYDPAKDPLADKRAPAALAREKDAAPVLEANPQPETQPTEGAEDGRKVQGQAPAEEVSPEARPSLKGEKIDDDWTVFSKNSGTLGIPRSEMPQIMAEHRGALVNFLNARGIGHEADEVPPESLKPTQAEFSPEKVEKAMESDGDRSILVSEDDHVLDGHHQWVAKYEAGEPVKVIRLKAPIRELLNVVAEFPSAEQAAGSDALSTTDPASAIEDGNQSAAGQADETPQITEAEARKRLEWRDLGQSDGTKTWGLYFKDADGGTLRYGTVSKYAGSRWEVDGHDGGRYEGLQPAKKKAEDIAVVRLRRDGYVAPAETDAQGLNDRDTFTLTRLNRETNVMEPVTFKRGEYVEVTLIGSSKKDYGEIDGISQARREFSVGGLWHPMGAAYKAERPAAPVKKTDPLSKTIEKLNAKHGAGLTEADRVPEQAPASKTPTVDSHFTLMEAVGKGGATAEQFKQGFNTLIEDKEAVKAELDTKTKADLLSMGGYWLRARYASEKKGEVVDAFYRNMVGQFALGETLSYGMGKGAYEAAVRRLVDATDDAKLEQYAKERQQAIEEAKAQRASREAGMENPQTLDDFRNVMNAKIREGMTRAEAFLTLTPEQRIKYDELEAQSTREAREAKKRAQKTEVRAAGQATGGEIIQTKHTRDGHDLWVVRLSDRLSTEDYKTVLASAKRLGGGYSSFRGNGAVPGFQFRTPEAAQAFLKLAGGDAAEGQGIAHQRRDAFEDDRSQSAVERLTEMADKLEERAQEALARDRKTNTARRARFAAAADREAEETKALAKTMRNIAEAIKEGRAEFLDAVRTKPQVELLRNRVAAAKSEELRAKYPSYADQEKRRGEPATAETADFAEFPAYTAFRSDLASLARQMLEVEGTKKLGQQLMSVADDVTDAYLAFAKENIIDVSTFSIRQGDEVKAAIFPSKDAAERAIRRSGLADRAIVLAEKRGVNRIIMSPSEAINRGVWKGDADKRITLSREAGTALVEAIGRRGNKTNRLSVPWQFQTAYDRLNALKRIGIETPSEYRSALREFIGLQESAIVNKVREMELAMVGRKNDGLDFFPTPEEVADQMVAAADIKPDMAVLEPSAGMGHIADRIREAGAEPDVIELAEDRRELLREKGYIVSDTRDFLDMKPRQFFTYGDVFRAPDGTEGLLRSQGGMGSNRVRLVSEAGVELGKFDRDELVGVRHNGSESGYDRIIMNPPFSNGRDIEHVLHAFTLLKPGGRIVAIMGESAFFNQSKKAEAFRQWLEEHGGTSEKLPAGSFMDPSLPVNTGVNARMVVVDKPVGETAFVRRSSAGSALPDAIIGRPLGDLNSHPEYAAAKAGDPAAALAVAEDLVTEDMVSKVKALGDGVVVVPVVSVEAAGRNKIPLAVAEVLADRAGLKTDAAIVQTNSPKRTGMDGLDRLLSPPEFDGPVVAGKSYVLVDDTITQGGTFAALASHIADNGGIVSGVISLTGKQYSARIAPSQDLLEQVRAKFGDIESDFRAATGYGFDALTESEARYLVRHDRPERIRNRVAEARVAASQRLDEGATGQEEGLTPASQDQGAAPQSEGQSNGFRRPVPDVAARAKAAQVEMVENIVLTLVRRWRNAPEVVVLASMDDAPARVREENERQIAGGASGVPAAFFYGGKAYIMASEMKTIADVRKAVFHEVLGHLGLRGLYGKQLNDILAQVAKVRRREVAQKASSYGLDINEPRDLMMAAEEVLAEMAQENPRLGFVRRAIAAVRSWLRSNVPVLAKMRMTDDEIINEFILPVQRFIKRGPQDPNRRMVPAFQRREPGMSRTERRNTINVDGKERSTTNSNGQPTHPTEGGIRNFWRWFGDSKVVDKDGKPLVVYHGTRGDITRFDPKRTGEASDAGYFGTGVYFAQEPDVSSGYAKANGAVYPVYLSIQNPFEWKGSLTQRVRQAQSRGGARAVSEISAGKDTFEASWYGNNLSQVVAFSDVRMPASIHDAVLSRAGVTQAQLDSVAVDKGNYGEEVNAKRAKYTRILGDALTAELKARGYDGVRVTNPIAGRTLVEWVAFSPEQIKSATGNNGQFDPASTDIGFSRAATARQYTGKAREAVQDFLGAAGTKVDWLDRTFKTQYAKAQKFPEFGKVFNRLQQYIESVSTLANQAADKAPSILPKLDTVSDLWKHGVWRHGLKDEDKKAIAAPIFEGTLEWSRTPDGGLVKVEALEKEAEGLTSAQKESRLLRDRKVSSEQVKAWKASKLDVYEGAIRNAYEREYLGAGVVFTDEELRDLYKLTPEQIGQYREFRAAVDESLDEMTAAEVVRLVPGLPDDVAALAESADGRARLREEVEKFLGDENNSLWNQVQDKYNQAEKLKSRGYAPLSRFGKFYVHLVDEAGQTQFFGLAETRYKANALAREMRGEFPGATVDQGVMSQQQYKLMSAVPLDSMELFAQAIGADQSEVFQKYIQLAKNNRSTMKRLIRRKGTAGFSGDVPRVLANFVTSNARAAASALHVKTAKDMAAEIRAGDVKDEAVKLIEAVTEPEESGAAIRGLMFTNFIGGSIASAVVNITQPVMMTMPYLSQWGGAGKASSRLIAAARMAITRTGGDAELRAALKRAEDDGIVSPQEIHHLIQRAVGGLADQNPVIQKLAFVWGAPFSLAEQFNRRATFIAAYQTAKEEGIEDPFQFAEKAVIETQGLYNAGNKPNAARGVAGATAMTFKQYSVHYLEWLSRMAKSGKPGQKAALLALAMLFLAAGADGLPFMDDMDDLIDTVGQAMGYDTNAKRWRHEAAAAILGDDLGEVAARGFSAMSGFPLDVSMRMGMGNLLPATDLLLKSNTDTARSVSELAGPGGALLMQYRDAAKAILSGDVGTAAQRVVPVALQNLTKGAQMAATGEYRDQRDRKVADADLLDAGVKALGFQPAQIARESGRLADFRQSESLARMTEAEITDKWARAIVDGDREAEKEALAMRDDWNEKNPDMPIVVKRTQAMRKARQMRMDRKDRFLKTVAPERRKAAAQEFDA